MKEFNMRNLFSLLAIFAMTTPAFADFAAVPQEVLVDEADLIVVGKVTKVEDGGFFTLGPRKFDHAVKQDVAVVEVSAILKASPQIGKPKVVHIGQLEKGIVSTVDIRFRSGQQGIWLLTKNPGPTTICAMKDGLLLPDPERNVYWAKHPGLFLAEKEAKKIADLVAARSKVPGGKPIDGLVARAELVQAPGIFNVRFSLKNVSDKAIMVCDYVGNRPLQVAWTGPDGKSLESKHYHWLRAARIAALAQKEFFTIQPGGVRFMGEIKFHSPAEKVTNFDNVAQVGKHQITVGFATKEDGKQFGLEKVWTGTVTASDVTFTVK